MGPWVIELQHRSSAGGFSFAIFAALFARIDSFVQGDNRQAPHIQGADPMTEKPPKALDAIPDIVVAYKPKPKTKPAKKRPEAIRRVVDYGVKTATLRMTKAAVPKK